MTQYNPPQPLHSTASCIITICMLILNTGGVVIHLLKTTSKWPQQQGCKEKSAQLWPPKIPAFSVGSPRSARAASTLNKKAPLAFVPSSLSGVSKLLKYSSVPCISSGLICKFLVRRANCQPPATKKQLGTKA